MDSDKDLMDSLKKMEPKNKEIPAVINMLDPFSNNWEVIQEYLKHQKKVKKTTQTAKEELETIQEKISSINSSKSTRSYFSSSSTAE
jgi:archaellum component FlaC